MRLFAAFCLKYDLFKKSIDNLFLVFRQVQRFVDLIRKEGVLINLFVGLSTYWWFFVKHNASAC